ncbi:glucokinase [Escherichia coli]
MAIPMLKKEHLIQFGGAEPVEGKPIAVYGAGTGLGVAHLVHVDKRWVSLPGEGGHVDFAPNSEEEAIILEILRAEIGHVSAERVLSGPGLVNLYRAIVKADNRLQKISSQKILPNVRWLIAAPIAAARCRCFASLWAVLAAIWRSISGHLARFLLRAVSCALPEFFKASGFRAAFEDKGRFKEYVHDIPVYLIVHDNPGLLGSGAHLRQTLGHIL